MPSESMSTAEECRRKAKEAEEVAERCTDIEAKRLFRLVAQEWRDIAALRERNVL
jgi:hypothetical protein